MFSGRSGAAPLVLVVQRGEFLTRGTATGCQAPCEQKALWSSDAAVKRPVAHCHAHSQPSRRVWFASCSGSWKGSGVLRHQLAVPRPGGLSPAQAARAFVAVAWLPQPVAARGERASPVERPGEARQTMVPTLVCSGLGGDPDSYPSCCHPHCTSQEVSYHIILFHH